MTGRKRKSAGSSQQAAHRLIALSVVLPLLLFAAAAVFDRRAILDAARDQVMSTTNSLAEHAQKVLETADLVLKRQLDHVDGLDWQQIGTSRPLYDFLASVPEELPQVESAFFVDPEGFNSTSSRAFPMRPYDVRTREYYLAALRGEDGLYVSAPFNSQMMGTAGFTVSRARVVDGRFDGLAAVTISPSYFERFYAEVIRRSPNSAATFLRQDGAILARYPPVPDGSPAVPALDTLLREASTASQGWITARSPIDGSQRIGAFRRLAGQDLLVLYSVDEATVLHGWYIHLAAFAAFAVLGAVALLSTARLVLQRGEQERTTLRLLLEETTRRQRAELALQQAQKMEALGRLTGGVAHDFNNLLCAVIGSLELARKRVDEPRAVSLLDNAATAAQRGAKLTAQMLAFSRNQDMEMRPIAVNDIIAAMEGLIRQTLGSLSVLRMDLQPDPWPAIGDSVQLEMALLNFAANARDAMPAGGELTVSTRNLRLDAPDKATGDLVGEFVRIAVRDTGAGMPEEARARAFEPFYTTKGPGKGTGLGLSTVYGFAVQAGGAATIASAPGDGTIVTLYLPRAAQMPAAVPAAAPIGRQEGRLRVLLVDDDPQVRMLTREMLAEAGHDAIDVGSGPAALDILRGGGAFDLLLADFAMPVMNGSQLAAEAARLRPDLPVLLMTGFVDNLALKSWLDLGRRALRKPFGASELAEALIQATAARHTAPARGDTAPTG